jgi:hypothetical protein
LHIALKYRLITYILVAWVIFAVVFIINSTYFKQEKIILTLKYSGIFWAEIKTSSIHSMF